MLLSRMLDARSRPPSHPCPATSYRLPHGVPHGYLGASSHLVVPSSRPFRRGGARIALTSRIDVAMRLLSSDPSRPAASAKHTKNSNNSRRHAHTRRATTAHVHTSTRDALKAGAAQHSGAHERAQQWLYSGSSVLIMRRSEPASMLARQLGSRQLGIRLIRCQLPAQLSPASRRS